MSFPSFIKSGSHGKELTTRGNYLRIEAGKSVRVVCLTDIDAPDGVEPNGSNGIISFQQYVLWKDRDESSADAGGSPTFPSIGGPGDPGKLLGLTPKFKALAIVAQLPPGPLTSDVELTETIWPMTISVFRQLTSIREAIGESIKGLVLNVRREGEGMKTKYTVVSTGKTLAISEEPITNLLDAVGPKTREDIIEMLVKSGDWPPPGGDPFDVTVTSPSPKAKATTKPATKPMAKPVTTTPASEDGEVDLPGSDDEFEEISE